jgi:hypothetical protein
MKWLVVIVILIAIAAAMVWLRTVRQGPATTRSDQPHRLDDSLDTPLMGPNPGSPIPHDRPADPATTGLPTDAGQPGSDFNREPEITGPDDAAAGPDPSRPGA